MREIVEYYRRLGETTRLAEGGGRLEFLRTWDVLTRTLPAAPAAVLDVGGATGVYAAPLAEAGYAVQVVDPVPEHVAAAGAWPGVRAAVGDARALDEADGSYDAVLLLGPLYHLLDRADRVTAWREAGRVVRPGGPVIGATINRFASMLDGFLHGSMADPMFVELVDRDLDHGTHLPSPQQAAYFTTAYFHHPDELPGEVADAGLALDRVVGVEGPLWLIESRLPELLATPELVLRMLRRVESEPTLLGASSHLLTIARRRG